MVEYPDKYYGLLQYKNSYNLGDEIQSIAAAKILKCCKPSCLIDRDTSTIDYIENVYGQDINVIYNGWFDGNYCKFPPPENINPLFISFHINEEDKDSSYDCLNSSKIKFQSLTNYSEFFKKFGPVGCRDLHTYNKLKEKNIDCYFSGCLTLTLKNRFKIRTDEILVVDCDKLFPSTFKKIIPQSIRDQAIYISQAVNKLLSHDEKFQLAQEYLDRLAKAKLVITSRLHTAMPCVAFKTPVIFIHDNLKDVRFSGLLQFVNFYDSSSEPIKEENILLSYSQNPKNENLSKIQKSLRRRVRKWKTKNFVRKGNSIIVSCMNRNSHLEKTFPSWINSSPDEIIIVDWGSENPVSNIVTPSSKVKLITVKNVKEWNLTKSYNLAARFAKYENILKVDCDTILHKDFFHYHNLDEDNDDPHFYAGDWRKSRNNNEKHTNGIVYLRKKDFFEIGGYNEFITTYGYDDCDLYNRLVNNSFIKRRLLNLDFVEHLEHPATQRFQYQTLEIPYRLDIEIEKNRLISSSFQKCVWGKNMLFSKFSSSNNSNELEFVFGLEISSTIKKECTEKAIKNISYRKTIEENPKKIYINVQNGLGNRLRALASAYNIAKNSKRQLIVIWIPDFHCNCKLTDLYDESNFEGITILDKEINFSSDEYVKYRYSEFDFPSDITIYNYSKNKNIPIDTDQSHDIYVISACVLSSPLTDWKQECLFLQTLKPVKNLYKIVRTFLKDSNFKEDVIGVHIRMGQPSDIAVYEDTKSWSEKSKEAIELWRKKSNYKIFMKEMDRVVSKFPNQKFFLCCDNEFIYQEIINSNKYNLIYTEKKVYDRSLEQIQTAVVDLYLLSKTKYILGSNWSSFTEIAHRIHGGKVKLAGVDF